jgi:Flp pilus assembly protein TadD
MFCHADVVTPIENTLNRYTQPLFERQSAIGCERCHGPGELHVASHRRGDASKPDLTIVNPARLAPALREAVCQQCHLQGEAQIVRRGKALFDYRPGLPLHEFVTIFVKAPHLSDSRKAVSHTEEMYSSRCFQGTKGKANALGCVSCHDPHQLPMPEARVEHYRSSCLKCHGETSCHLEPAARKKLQADDSCIACHMQAARSNIPHAAITDHRISRRPDQPPKPKKELQWAGIGLLHFHRDLVDADKEDIGRDLGVALIEMAREMGTDTPTVTNLARSALAFLENGLEEHPDDLDARESQIYGLCCLGQQEGAYPLLKHLLEQVPDRERALDDAVRIATYLGRTEEALRYGRRLLKVNPWQPRYRAEMANVHARRQEWADAIRECKESLRLDPTSETTRSLLVSCYIRMGDKKNAQLEFKRIMAMGPRDPKGLRTWFDNEMK